MKAVLAKLGIGCIGFIYLICEYAGLIVSNNIALIFTLFILAMVVACLLHDLYKHEMNELENSFSNVSQLLDGKNKARK